MFAKTASLILAAALLAACGGSKTQVLVDAPAPALRLSPLVSSIEIKEVSLPRYAASDAVVLVNGGVVNEVSGNIWADDPERSVTQALARNIGIITGARVFAEPWPFAGQPGAAGPGNGQHYIVAI